METLRPAGVDPLVQGPVMAAMLALIAIEALLLILVFRRRYDAGETAASLGVALGNIALRPVNRLIITAGLSAVAVFAPWQLPIDSVWTWVFGFIGVEFCYYWMHRFAHTVRWIWTTHSVHHSSGRFTLATALRLGWTNGLSGEWLVFAPLVLIGFPPLVIAVLLALNLLYQFFLHTELSPRWSVLGGILEFVLNTPAHHRIHHASNDRYLDKNFGGVVIVFDRLFGTFARDDGSEPVRFGLTEPLTSTNPFVIALDGWWRMVRDLLRVRTLKAAVTVLFGRPG